MTDDAPLEVLRCRRGCDPRFLQYLCWEGTDLRIISEQREWRSGGQYGPVGGFQTTYNIGLRCGDCGLHAGRKDVPHAAKEALDALLIAVAHDLQDLVDQADTDLIAELMGGSALLMEENG